MNKNLESSVEQFILDALERAEKAVDGSTEREREVNNVVAMYKAMNDLKKAELEYETKEAERENAEKLKGIDSKQAQKEIWVKVATTAAQIIIPLVFYGCWTTKMMRFEELGHIPTSGIFRQFVNQIRPKG